MPALMLRVRVFDIETDTQIREHSLNYSSHESREWLKNLIVWAGFNKKSVELLNISDDVS